MKRRLILFATLCLFLALVACAPRNETPGTSNPSTPEVSYPTPDMFPLSEDCVGCHDSIKAADGSSYSFVEDWSKSVHSQSALDPLFLTVARSEAMTLPEASDLIQSVCAACHLPMADFMAQSTGASQSYLDNAARSNHELYALYKDGDSCMICHQTTSLNVPGNESFLGSKFSLDTSTPKEGELRSLYGLYDLKEGGQVFMMNSLGYRSVQDKALGTATSNCAVCHTLYTDSFTVEGVPTGKKLPEQVTALEWGSSSYTSSPCQNCHMPEITKSGPLSNRQVADGTLGLVRKHSFAGANAYLLRLLNDRFGSLDAGIAQTQENLGTKAASLTVSGKIDQNPDGSGLLSFDVAIASDVGHKFPTGFPSRRAWIHVQVLDEAGNVIFESGAFDAKGMILDNDGDLKKGEFEPHYEVIDRAGQVQIYESVMIDSNGKATTNLLQGVYFGKDNRLLPKGFDKKTANPDCAVVGGALQDADFIGGSDTVRYRIVIPQGAGKVTVKVELLYQTVSYRFLENLKEHSSAEQKALEGLVQKNPNTPELVATMELSLGR